MTAPGPTVTPASRRAPGATVALSAITLPRRAQQRLDPGPQRLGGGQSSRPGGLEHRLVDGGDRLNLARGGGEESLVGSTKIVERAHALARSRQLDHVRPGNRSEDV